MSLKNWDVINYGIGGNSRMNSSKSDGIRALTKSLPVDPVTQSMSQRSLGTLMTYSSAPSLLWIIFYHSASPSCPPAILFLHAVPQAMQAFELAHLPARNANPRWNYHPGSFPLLLNVPLILTLQWFTTENTHTDPLASHFPLPWSYFLIAASTIWR